MTLSISRSVMTLRLPLDEIEATLMLRDGTVLDASLFVSAFGDLSRFLEEPEPFVAARCASTIRFIARAALVYVAVSAPLAPLAHGEIGAHLRRVVLHLSTGTSVRGLLCRPSSAAQRTLDYLNSPGTYIELQGPTSSVFVAKNHITMMEEA